MQGFHVQGGFPETLSDAGLYCPATRLLVYDHLLGKAMIEAVGVQVRGSHISTALG